MSRARELLGPGGPLARAMSGYEHREGQLQMAEAVERALNEDRIVLCEAGTGTGKTLAYLVPALCSGRKVVVSTASKALQEQIVHKDVPLIREHLGLEADVVLVKGLGNYLCRRRLAELEYTAAIEGESKQRAARGALPVVRSWASESSVGDVAELSALEESHPIWQLVTSSSDTRIGRRCSYFEDCFVTELKRRAESAQVLVVNHHLFFADLAIRGDHPGRVLPDYDAVILDEAHKIEDIATSFFGASASSAGVARMLGDTERTMRAAGIHEGSDPPSVVQHARAAAHHLFSAVNAIASTFAPHGETRCLLEPDMWSGALLERYHAFDNALDAVAASVRPHAEDDRLRFAVQRLERMRAEVAMIAEPTSKHIAWVETSQGAVRMTAAPVDVGPILRDKLFSTGAPITLTSASMTSAGRFDFVRSRIGLDEEVEIPVDEIVVPSSIDHTTQALLYLPQDLPQVQDDSFGEEAADRIRKLIDLTPGGAFILCTSTRAMTALAQRLGGSDRLMLRQGDAPKRALLERFRRDGSATLVATMSFWEGVDVPGQALRLVVINRLPFAVPTDPLVAARCQTIEEQGRSAFSSYSVPRAGLILKQGFGRLLRNRDDYGIVAVLDKRIRTRSYGQTLLDSLPPCPHTSQLEDVETFWRERASW